MSSAPGGRLETMWAQPPTPIVLPWGPFLSGPTAVSTVALLLIAGGAALLRRAPTAGHRALAVQGAFWAAVGIFQSLTPTVLWRGTLVTTPQGLLARWLPMVGTLREPARLGVAGLIGLSLLAGVTFAAAARRLGSSRVVAPALAAALAALMYADYSLGLGKPTWGRLDPFRIVPVLRAQSPVIHVLVQSDGALLELPNGPRGISPATHATAMYRSIFHWRPLLNGYSSYWPPGFRQRMASRCGCPTMTRSARSGTRRVSR